MSFVGKVAVVVGGAGGIGSETARHLLLQGVDRLAIFDVFYSQVGIERLQNEFPKKVVVFRKTDVTDRLEVERSFKEIALKFERIDIVVNSVGIVNETSIENTLSTNLIGVINSTQTAIEHMSIEKGGRGGWIVNVSSVLGLDSLFSAPLYSASKHAIIGFTRSLADPFYSRIYGINFVIICPGVTITPMIHDLTDLLYRTDAEEATVNLFEKMGTQSAEECGRSLVEILPKAENGSVWMVDSGKVKEIVFKKHWLKN